MNTILNLLTSRRIGAFVSIVVSAIAFTIGSQIDVANTTKLICDVLQAFGQCLGSGLALWSYLSPKK